MKFRGLLIPLVLSTAIALGAGMQAPLQGRALRQDGSPAAGARVSLIVTLDGYRTDTLVETSSRPDGAYVFEPLPAGPETHLRYLVLEVQGEGLAFQRIEKDVLPPLIRAERPATYRAKLVDERGRPIAGVRAGPRFLRGGSGSFVVLPEAMHARLSATSAADGQVTFSHMPTGCTIQLRHDDPRFAQFEWNDQPSETAAMTITMGPGASVSGRVTLPDGAPAVGVKVGAQAANGYPDGWGQDVTDSQGRYTLRCLQGSHYNVALDLKGEWERDWTAKAHDTLPVPKGEHVKGVDFTLEKGAQITGRVLDQHGNPVSGMGVGVYGPAHPDTGAWVQVANTAGDGRYTLRVPAGRQKVYVMSGTDSQRTIELKDGDVQEENFTLPAPKAATGVVVDDRGQPVAGAIVRLLDDYGIGFSDPSVTGDDGRFKFLDAGFRALHVQAFAKEDASPFVTEVGEGDVRLVLQNGVLGRIEGLVVDPFTEPIPGATVLVSMRDDRTGVTLNLKTDAQGRFVAEPVWHDVWVSVTIEAPDHERAEMELQPTGRKVDLQPRFRLKRAYEVAEGVVVDPAGRPMPGVEVSLEGYMLRRTHTDAKGRFRLEGLPGGDVYLQAMGGKASGRALKSGDGKVKIVLKPWTVGS